MQGCYIQRDIYKPTQTTNHHLTARELTPPCLSGSLSPMKKIGSKRKQVGERENRRQSLGAIGPRGTPKRWGKGVEMGGATLVKG